MVFVKLSNGSAKVIPEGLLREELLEAGKSPEYIDREIRNMKSCPSTRVKATSRLSGEKATYYSRAGEGKFCFEWTGPRGGKWWTTWVSEEEARSKMAEIGETCPGTLYEKTSFCKLTIKQNKKAELLQIQRTLDGHLQKRDSINKAIKSCRDTIRQLETEIKEVK